MDCMGNDLNVDTMYADYISAVHKNHASSLYADYTGPEYPIQLPTIASPVVDLETRFRCALTDHKRVRTADLLATLRTIAARAHPSKITAVNIYGSEHQVIFCSTFAILPADHQCQYMRILCGFKGNRGFIVSMPEYATVFSARPITLMGNIILYDAGVDGIVRAAEPSEFTYPPKAVPGRRVVSAWHVAGVIMNDLPLRCLATLLRIPCNAPRADDDYKLLWPAGFGHQPLEVAESVYNARHVGAPGIPRNVDVMSPEVRVWFSALGETGEISYPSYLGDSHIREIFAVADAIGMDLLQ